MLPLNTTRIFLLTLLMSLQSALAVTDGDLAPEFNLMGSDGKFHALKDYRGRTVVLAWFPKAFTGG
jgi:peroxiredoxin Q/BCP